MQDFSGALADLARRVADAEGYLRIGDLRARRPQLETELGRPDLWDDQAAAQAVQREFAAVNDDLTLYGSYAYTNSTLRGSVDAFGDGIYDLDGKTFINTPKNSAFMRLNYEHGPFWASLDAKYRGAIWGDWYNTEKVGGYTTFNFSTGVNLPDFASWFTRPAIKLNVFNLTDHHAFAYANSNTLLATRGFKDVNGVNLFASSPFYILLEPRTYMVTLSATFR